jgi:hypothetical protein
MRQQHCSACKKKKKEKKNTVYTGFATVTVQASTRDIRMYSPWMGDGEETTIYENKDNVQKSE